MRAAVPRYSLGTALPDAALPAYAPTRDSLDVEVLARSATRAVARASARGPPPSSTVWHASGRTSRIPVPT